MSIMDTEEKIIEYIKEKGQATGKQLADFLGITDRAVRKQIGKLYSQGILTKTGKPPKVFYLIKGLKKETENEVINDGIKKILEENYLIITPAGEMKMGVDGFSYWCERNKLPVIKTAEEYVTTLSKYDAYKKDGLIDGTEKIKSLFADKVGLDKVFYLSFYAIERFGKTKLGQLLLYAKQSQDKKLMKKISDESRAKILSLIAKYDIDAVGFIPPTVKREVQLMKELKSSLALPVRDIKIVKAQTEVVVPQKTLNKIEDRMENAQKSIFVTDNNKYKNILLIDDAVGSGATLNETALQIRRLGLCSGKIIGLAITGSFKGFDVISEV